MKVVTNTTENRNPKKSKIKSIEGIKIKELFEKCVVRQAKLISEEEFYTWLDNNIKVKKYIPIAEKYAMGNIIDVILNTNFSVFNTDTTSQLFSIFESEDKSENDNTSVAVILENYDLLKMFLILSQYLGLPFEAQHRTTDNYDLIFESGLFDYIMKFCEKDYNSFNQLINRLIGIDYLTLTRELTGVFRSLPTNDKLDEFKKTVNNVNPEIFDKITEFNAVNDPLIKQVTTNIDIIATAKAMGKDTAEKE